MQQPKQFNYKLAIAVPYVIKICSIKIDEKKTQNVQKRNTIKVDKPTFNKQYYKGAGFEQDSKVVNKILFFTIKDFKLL